MRGATTPDTPEDGSVPSSTTDPRSKGRQSRSTGEITRARVLRSAVNCILEEGYYQTSSNDIARRAGVTWGALQYQFGRRETLLLEVLRASWQELHEHIRSARITGATLEERLDSLLELLATHYAHPDHLAELQILLDLSHDPSTSDTAKEAIALHGAELNRLWQPLFEQVLGDAATDQGDHSICIPDRPWLSDREPHRVQHFANGGRCPPASYAHQRHGIGGSPATQGDAAILRTIGSNSMGPMGQSIPEDGAQ
jgi:AcrR family transcriptional regulator